MTSTRNVVFIEQPPATIPAATGVGGQHDDDDELVYEDFKLDFDSTDSSVDIINDDTNDRLFDGISALESTDDKDSRPLGSSRRLRSSTQQ